MRDWMLTRRAMLATTAAATAVRAAAPARLVGAIEETPPSINPAISAVISTHATGTSVYGALTHILPDGTVQNELAEHWEMSPDGLTYTFHLRPDVSWHDDAPFSSADVKFSIENANGKLHQAGRGAFRMVDRIDAPDAQTVVFRLRAPYAALIYGTDSYCGAILPKHLWDGTDILKNPHNLQPVGTGPYRLVEFASGEFLRYQRFDKYFLPGLPHYDEVVLRIVPDAASRIAAFENGELDMLYHSALPWPEVPRIEKTPGVAIQMTNLRGAAYLNLATVGVRTTLQPLDRLALNQKGYVAGQFDMIAETYGLGPDPDMGVERLYNGGNIHTPGIPFTNTSGYADPAVDALFERQRVQTDPAVRKAIYDQIQQAIWRDLPVLPLFSYSAPNAYWSNRVTGLFQAPTATRTTLPTPVRWGWQPALAGAAAWLARRAQLPWPEWARWVFAGGRNRPIVHCLEHRMVVARHPVCWLGSRCRSRRSP